MIVRQPIKCETCDTVHVARTGLGRASRQEHLFACRTCEQEIGFVLKLDQANGGIEYESWTHCVPVDAEPEDAPIVNLEADFLIPANMQGVDRTFSRMEQFGAIIKAREASGRNVFELGVLRVDGARGGDARGEWLDLRRAWTLTRSKQGVLAKARVQAASKQYYGDPPLDELGDWIFRFSQLLGGEPVLTNIKVAMDALSSVRDSKSFSELARHYNENMAPSRGRLYLDVFNGFFNAYDDLNPLEALIREDIEIDSSLEITSVQFEKTKMFYGNAFEALGSLADMLAYANNVLQGRRWDEFELLTVKQYLQLDKSARFGPFAAIPGLAALSKEADNQLRNASHHGSMEIDAVTKVVTYRAGKGGQGESRTMSYTEYLKKCVVLFNQILALFCLEILLFQTVKNRPF